MEHSDWRISVEDELVVSFSVGEKVIVPESEPDLAINRAMETNNAINNESFKSGFKARFIHAMPVSTLDSARSRS